jgi:hypothetical protein
MGSYQEDGCKRGFLWYVYVQECAFRWFMLLNYITMHVKKSKKVEVLYAI